MIRSAIPVAKHLLWMALFAVPVLNCATTQKPAPKHKKHHAAQSHRSVAAKKSPGKTSVHAKRGKKTAGKTASRRGYRSGQQQPAPERYKEIQQALADRGYYTGPVNGEWGPEGTEGLRRFQKDQSLEPDGKLGSVSLIALGLGPKRTLSAQAKPAVAPPKPPGESQ